MKNAKIRTTATVAFMIVLAIAILVFYYYWSNRTDPIDTTGKHLNEVEKMIDYDLTTYYPETPREVVKLFAGMMKAMYNHPEDEKINELALKVRNLYDEEFLNNNPESTYLTNLSKDLAKWKKKKQKISNYLMVNEEGNQEKEMNGVEYSTQYVSFTIQKNGKFTEIWKVLLRQDSDKKWKILGWKSVSENDSVK